MTNPTPEQLTEEFIRFIHHCKQQRDRGHCPSRRYIGRLESLLMATI